MAGGGKMQFGNRTSKMCMLLCISLFSIELIMFLRAQAVLFGS